MKDLGETKIAEGMKIIRTFIRIKLSWEHYVKKIIYKFKHYYKSVSIPNNSSSKLKKNKQYSVS